MLRMPYSKPFLRNVIYAVVLVMSLYGLFFITSSEEYLPHFPFQRPIPSPLWQDRAAQVKAAFVHAYHGYEKYAAPHDELRPNTRVGSDHYNGWGVTAFDALDTMLLMRLEDEYKRALHIVERTHFNKTMTFIPLFETVIRYLGGLLSAYAMSSDRLLLDRAEELAILLDPVFNTSSGLARFGVDPATGILHGPNLGVLAEFASLQLEYTYLAKLTGKAEYLNRSETVMNIFNNANLTNTGGMLPIRWDLTTGEPWSSHLSVGAQADSTHEYLLKLFLLTGKTDKRSLILYLRATTQIITQLLYLTPKRNLLYVTDITASPYQRPVPSHTFEHLSCFLPGLLALGAHSLPLDRLDSFGIDLAHLGNETLYGKAGNAYNRLSQLNLKELHMWAAEGIAQTCYLSYADSATGLGPDEMKMDVSHGPVGQEDQEAPDFLVRRRFQPRVYPWLDAVESWIANGRKGSVPGLAEKKPVLYTMDERLHGTGIGRDYVMRKADYLLRPETVESFFFLWKTTGNPQWREWGWEIFQAIERETRTGAGYAYVRNVDIKPPVLGDAMPSFFLAETLKYLYLLFQEDDPITLDKWVFNTEAHPFPVFQWTPEEKIKFSLL